jgi:hypothetical protein
VVTVSAVGREDEPVAHVWYVNVGIYEPVALNGGTCMPHPFYQNRKNGDDWFSSKISTG